VKNVFRTENTKINWLKRHLIHFCIFSCENILHLLLRWSTKTFLYQQKYCRNTNVFHFPFTVACHLWRTFSSPSTLSFSLLSLASTHSSAAHFKTCSDLISYRQRLESVTETLERKGWEWVRDAFIEKIWFKQSYDLFRSIASRSIFRYA